MCRVLHLPATAGLKTVSDDWLEIASKSIMINDLRGGVITITPLLFFGGTSASSLRNKEAAN